MQLLVSVRFADVRGAGALLRIACVLDAADTPYLGPIAAFHKWPISQLRVSVLGQHRLKKSVFTPRCDELSAGPRCYSGAVRRARCRMRT